MSEHDTPETISEPAIPAAQVVALLGAIGGAGFVPAALGFAQAGVGADFVSVFCCGDRDVPLLIGTAGVNQQRAAQAAKGYAQHFSRDRNAALLTNSTQCGDFITDQRAGEMRDFAYRRDCYTRPGIAQRLSMIRRTRSYGLSVSLYRAVETGVFSADEAARAEAYLAVLLAASERHIAQTLRDRPWQSDDMLARLALTFQDLTDREREVIAMSLKGRSAAHIARILGLAETTIITHRKKAYRRLNVANLRELAARLNGLGSEDAT